MMETKTEGDSDNKVGSHVAASSHPESIEATETAELSTKRGLSARHAQFIALGGTIGTGLFVGSAIPLLSP